MAIINMINMIHLRTKPLLCLTHHEWIPVTPVNATIIDAMSTCAVEPVLKDPPLGNVVCQDRWSLVTGSINTEM